MVIKVQAQSNACAVFCCSSTGIMNLSPTVDMDVCASLFIHCPVQARVLWQTIPSQCYQMSTEIQKPRKWESWAMFVCSIIKIVLKCCFVYHSSSLYVCKWVRDCGNEFHVIQQSFLVWEVIKHLQCWTKKTDADAICLLASSRVNSPALQRGLLIVLPSIGKYDAMFLKGISQHGPLLKQWWNVGWVLSHAMSHGRCL